MSKLKILLVLFLSAAFIRTLSAYSEEELPAVSLAVMLEDTRENYLIADTWTVCVEDKELYKKLKKLKLDERIIINEIDCSDFQGVFKPVISVSHRDDSTIVIFIPLEKLFTYVFSYKKQDDEWIEERPFRLLTFD